MHPQMHWRVDVVTRFRNKEMGTQLESQHFFRTEDDASEFRNRAKRWFAAQRSDKWDWYEGIEGPYEVKHG